MTEIRAIGRHVARAAPPAEQPLLRRSFVLGLVSLACLIAGPSTAAPAEAEASADAAAPLGERTRQVFDRIWGYATFYDDPEGPILRRLAFKGRFQVDFPLFESNRGDYSEPQVRRLRLGLKADWAANLVAHLEVDLDVTCEKGESCQEDAYDRITDAYVSWKPNEAFGLKLGKASAGFTLDGATSSRSLITLERNNVSNNLWFPIEYHLGVSASGKHNRWRYLAGVYSSATSDELDAFGGGFFTLLTLARDFSKQLGAAEALLTLNYVYNQADKDNIATRDLSHVGSLHFRFDTGTFGFRSDLSGGIGYGSQSDLIGLALVPFYHFNEYFQLVGRYTFIESFGDDGIRFARYENRIELERGDRYNEFFVGLNWFIYDHEFKVQTGFKYTMMDDLGQGGGDYRGWGWTTGLRMSW
ncbi:MAG: hypothetical protein JRG96_06300 [Deltaproteobacteria bacterium]|nr:hypothetical protein [Deltaproteobacteria bacterium]MBW2419073.1 hypothetical protein [Deltaproteobacteria bacterium]